jgi:hypothetical protein
VALEETYRRDRRVERYRQIVREGKRSGEGACRRDERAEAMIPRESLRGTDAT